MKILERKDDCLEIDHEAWADVLLLASNWGWKPAQPTYFFLGTDVHVSEVDAHSLATAIDRVLAKALHDPINFYPVRADMGAVASVGEFCHSGAFTVR